MSENNPMETKYDHYLTGHLIKFSAISKNRPKTSKLDTLQQKCITMKNQRISRHAHRENYSN